MDNLIIENDAIAINGYAFRSCHKLASATITDSIVENINALEIPKCVNVYAIKLKKKDQRGDAIPFNNQKEREFAAGELSSSYEDAKRWGIGVNEIIETCSFGTLLITASDAVSPEEVIDRVYHTNDDGSVYEAEFISKLTPHNPASGGRRFKKR